MTTTTAAPHTCPTCAAPADPDQTPDERLAGLLACLAAERAELTDYLITDEHGGDVDQLAAMAANLDGPRPRTTGAAHPRRPRTPRA